MTRKTLWNSVSSFEGLTDGVFAAFDEFVRLRGIPADRFSAPAQLAAIRLERAPQVEDALWRLEPKPTSGALIAVCQSATDAAVESLLEHLASPEPLQCSRVLPRSRVGEAPGHLQGRARWFGRRLGEN
jgi:hypothetical protein